MSINKINAQNLLPLADFRQKTQEPKESYKEDIDIYDLDVEVKVASPQEGAIQHVTEGGACSASCLSCAYTCGNCKSYDRRC